jgi:hypothetical protein
LPLRIQEVILVSEGTVNTLYSGKGLAFDRSRGLVGATIAFSNNLGAQGLQGSVVPSSGLLYYVGSSQGSKQPTFTTASGKFNALSVDPGESGVEAFDVRSDFAVLELAPVRGGAATVDWVRVPRRCDVALGLLSPIYPCDGAVLTGASLPMDFYWDGAANNSGTLKYQVQISTDPGFGTIEISSKNSDGQFVREKHWRPSKKKWKKILALGDGGATVYWRVLQRENLADGTTEDTYSASRSLTVRGS